MDYLWVLEPEAEYGTIGDKLDTAGNEHDTVWNKHDKGYKYLLSVKRVFMQLLRSFVDESWVGSIDEDSIEYINKSFILQDFKGKEADIVYKLKIDGREVFFYILLELQSTVDFQMPYRLLQYMLEIWRTILKDTKKAIEKQKEASKDNTENRSEGKIGDEVERKIEVETKNEVENDINDIEKNKEMEIGKDGKDFRLPVIIPCILYNGEYNWTAPRSSNDILIANGLFDDYIIDFNYILFDVVRYDEEELLRLGNLVGAVFYIDQKQQYDEIIERLKNLVDQLKDLREEDFELFKIWLKNVVTRGMPKEEAKEIEKIIESNKEADSMVYNMEIAIRNKMKEVELKGKQEGKLDVAKNLFDAGMDIEQIGIVTNIPVDELQKLIVK
ncbi:MAG TPA: Rpn family recombination-promoting nuclease/putative transposase [Clostridiales bacterium]|nr:Rpn family recombination-promoting nuclease/putative transposase [Clostridiales bacterium]